MFQNKSKFVGAMLVCLVIIALSFTVIKQRQQLEELQVEIKATQSILIGYVGAYAKCYYDLKMAYEVCGK